MCNFEVNHPIIIVPHPSLHGLHIFILEMFPNAHRYRHLDDKLKTNYV